MQVHNGNLFNSFRKIVPTILILIMHILKSEFETASYIPEIKKNETKN